MPTYKYQAQTRDGEVVSNTIEAANLNLAIDQLTSKRLKILEITPVRFDLLNLVHSYQSVKLESVVMFTRQLQTLVKSGLSIDRSISVLQEQEENAKFKTVLSQVLREIRTGNSLSFAMNKHNEVFGSLYISMLKVGETTGDMPAILSRLAEFMERDLSVRQKTKSAMVYPIFVLITAVVVVAGIFLYVMPPLLETFKQMSGGQVLPLPTRLMFFLTDMFTNPITYELVGLVILYYFFFVRPYLASPNGKMKYDRFKLNIPLIGQLNKKLLVSHFCRVLGTLLSTGVPMLKSLNILADFSDNDYFKKSIITPMSEGLENGESISSLMEEANFFPNMVTNMVAVGESTGEMPRMLNRVSEFYDKEVVYTLDSLLSMIEPIMIACMGIGVCVVLLSIFLPLYSVIMSMG
ncbi:type II secretion system F family protein [bacterium]|nr:type II secretion system F family protein [bacterium]